jgi:hypothetical protein
MSAITDFFKGLFGGGNSWTNPPKYDLPDVKNKVGVFETKNISFKWSSNLQTQYFSKGLGDGSQSEHQKPLFNLYDGATIDYLRIGGPAGDGIHCYGGMIKIGVLVFDDVGEDAITLMVDRNTTLQIGTLIARKADDKVIQINGPANITIDTYICDQGAGKCFRVNGNAKKDNRVNVKVGKLHAKDVKWIFTSGKTLSGVKDANTTCRFEELWIEGNNKMIFDCEKAKVSYGKLYKK